MTESNERVEVGIIGALREETDALIAALQEHVEETVGSICFHTGLLEGRRVAVACCGVGKVFAALCAQAMVVRYAPAVLVNSGVGGAIAPGLHTGDLVIADRLVQHDMDTSALGDPVGMVSGINRVYFPTDETVRAALLRAAQGLGYPATVATIATGDRFIADREDKRRIADTFGASVCEMEGGAIAQVATVNGIPFAVIRAISDSADEGADMDYTTFLPLAASHSVALTRAYLASL